VGVPVDLELELGFLSLLEAFIPLLLALAPQAKQAMEEGFLEVTRLFLVLLHFQP
jgi:hypothetical protein